MPSKLPKLKLKTDTKPFSGSKRTKSPNEELYHDSKWTKASKQFREGKRCAREGQHPKCKGTPDTVEHVKNPALHPEIDFWDQSNWVVHCRSCAAAKSNKERAIEKIKNRQK